MMQQFVVTIIQFNIKKMCNDLSIFKTQMTI